MSEWKNNNSWKRSREPSFTGQTAMFARINAVAAKKLLDRGRGQEGRNRHRGNQKQGSAGPKQPRVFYDTIKVDCNDGKALEEDDVKSLKALVGDQNSFVGSSRLPPASWRAAPVETPVPSSGQADSAPEPLAAQRDPPRKRP